MRLGRPSHTTVVAYLALFIAIAGGTAIAAKKIGPDRLKKNAVTTKKIASAAVTTPKLASDAVTGGKLSNGSVGEGKIDADAVTANKLAPNSVGTNKIRDEAVESAKLGAGAVTEGKIGNDAVVGSKVAPGSLPLDDIAQVAAGISTAPLGPIAAGNCVVNGGLAVPGLAAGDDVLVFPRSVSEGWNPALILDGYAADGASTVVVQICNTAGGPIGPVSLPLTVLGFR
jgi:hypothetical protein